MPKHQNVLLHNGPESKMKISISSTVRRYTAKQPAKKRALPLTRQGFTKTGLLYIDKPFRSATTPVVLLLYSGSSGGLRSAFANSGLSFKNVSTSLTSAETAVSELEQPTNIPMDNITRKLPTQNLNFFISELKTKNGTCTLWAQVVQSVVETE